VEKQIADRVPGLAVGVSRRGHMVWFVGIGSADLSLPTRPPDADTQFDIAGITSTFVAVTVMALRDAGKLSLDDPVERRLPPSRHTDVTVREALTHISGMQPSVRQREPVRDAWDAPHSAPHSQPYVGMLAELIARLDHEDWYAAVRRRVLDPLGLRSTSLGRAAGLPQAGRYYVPPGTDVPGAEPTVDLFASGPVGGFSSTARDLSTWGAFLADPTDEVLAADTVEEMCQPNTTTAPDGSLTGGLGLRLVRHEGRVWVGHTGAFPGTRSGCFTHRDSGTTGVVLMNQTAATSPGIFAASLGSYVLEHDPPLPPVWRPAAPRS